MTRERKERLVDLRDVHIDPSLPKAERIRSFVQQAKDLCGTRKHISYIHSRRGWQPRRVLFARWS